MLPHGGLLQQDPLPHVRPDQVRGGGGHRGGGGQHRPGPRHLPPGAALLPHRVPRLPGLPGHLYLPQVQGQGSQKKNFIIFIFIFIYSQFLISGAGQTAVFVQESSAD